MQNHHYILTFILSGIFSCYSNLDTKAQNCPPNIDFENGDFTGWVCYTGSVSSIDGNNVIDFNYSGGPIFNRHTMYNAPGAGFDEYGGFPKNCPNGSGHSIKLGNNSAGREAEGVSYDFTIPAGANTYNIIYNYAVVFQDPGHEVSEQPRLELQVLNVSDGTIIECSSFTFFANGTPLPGFELSPNPGGNTPVWYKNWTAVSINLDNLAGKKIRLFFKTADCTFRIHFGYAYIDVNTECSDRFEGANFCPDDDQVSVTAPYGYQYYRWYNNTFTQLLGFQQTLILRPPPPFGTTVAVVVEPYSGYGCEDTLYAVLTDTLTYQANAGPDKSSCNNSIAQIGVLPKPGWVYKWEPETGLSNPETANPYASPDTTTTYILTVHHDGGGCLTTDTVTVRAAKLYDSIQVIGKPEWCIGSGDSSILKVLPADSVQWFKDGIAIPGANQITYKVLQSGDYHAQLFSSLGCSINTGARQIKITSVPVPGFTVNKPEQCLANNEFVFINTSTNAVGAMEYKWILGDGVTATSKNLTYSYKIPGTYKVVLIVSSSSSCVDSASITVIVNPSVAAAFDVNPVCINKPVLPVNNTEEPANTVINYLWDFGNGQTSVLRNPPPQVYTTEGNYIMSLAVSTQKCPYPLSIQKRFVMVDKPVAGINYQVAYAVTNLPLSLNARPIGDEVLWQPATNLNNPSSYTPEFIGNTETVYKIELKTKSGCVTVDTQLVKINKEIVIYVPNAFTPNNDGLNDFLKPFMIGIKELKYFRVFNRWGQLIYETADAKKGWDGKQNGVPAQTHAYVWMMEALGADNKIYRAKGNTVLIR